MRTATFKLQFLLKPRAMILITRSGSVKTVAPNLDRSSHAVGLNDLATHSLELFSNQAKDHEVVHMWHYIWPSGKECLEQFETRSVLFTQL